MSKPKHTSEPWKAVDDYKRPMIQRDEVLVAEFYAIATRDRALSCLNACASIAHPENLGELVEMLWGIRVAMVLPDGSITDAIPQEKIKNGWSALFKAYDGLGINEEEAG